MSVFADEIAELEEAVENLKTTVEEDLLYQRELERVNADLEAEVADLKDAYESAAARAGKANQALKRVRALADEYQRGRGGPTAKRIRAAVDGEG